MLSMSEKDVLAARSFCYGIKAAPVGESSLRNLIKYDVWQA